MKKYFLIFILLISVLSACMEKDEIYPRPAETITIEVDHDTTLLLFDNQTYVLDASTGDSASYYSWNNGIHLPSISVDYPYQFLVQISTDTFFQQFNVNIIYSETPMYYPNSFSPNGDGLNDYWAPIGYNIDTNGYSLKIYNSDDHILYKTEQINYFFAGGWDGTVEGTPCPTGYYYYVVKYKTLNGEKHKDSGMLQLIR